MTHINQALGQQIIDGGLRRVEDDARIYGDAAAVVLSAARVDDLLHEIGGKTGADVFRRTIARKLGDLAVSALYAGDVSAILERGIADIARLAPIVDLQGRKASREKATDVERSFAAALDGFGEDGAASGTLGMAAE